MVDMREADCKEELSMTIEKADTNDISLWVDIYDDVCDKISNKLKNSSWEESFGLYEKSTNVGIRKLDDFVKVFDQLKDVKVMHFKLRVKNILLWYSYLCIIFFFFVHLVFFYFSIFLFFYFCLCLCLLSFCMVVPFSCFF